MTLNPEGVSPISEGVPSVPAADISPQQPTDLGLPSMVNLHEYGLRRTGRTRIPTALARVTSDKSVKNLFGLVTFYCLSS